MRVGPADHRSRTAAASLPLLCAVRDAGTDALPRRPSRFLRGRHSIRLAPRLMPGITKTLSSDPWPILTHAVRRSDFGWWGMAIAFGPFGERQTEDFHLGYARLPMHIIEPSHVCGRS